MRRDGLGMKFGFVWVWVLFCWGTCLGGVSRDYALKVSEAQNAYEGGDMRVCVSLCKHLIRLDASGAEAYFLLGRVYLERGYYRMALVELERARENAGNFLVSEAGDRLVFTSFGGVLLFRESDEAD